MKPLLAFQVQHLRGNGFELDNLAIPSLFSATTQMLFGQSWQNTGDVVEDKIREGLTNEMVLKVVREKYPDAQTSPASIRWYRSNLRKTDSEIPSEMEVRKKMGSNTS